MIGGTILLADAPFDVELSLECGCLIRRLRGPGTALAQIEFLHVCAKCTDHRDAEPFEIRYWGLTTPVVHPDFAVSCGL